MRAISTTYSYPAGMLPTMREEEDRLDREFEKEFDGISVLWDRIDLLRRTLLEKRAALDDSSNFRSALDLLAAKGISDARAAFVLVRRGYALACLGPLRSALEAVDLMQYFRLNPTEVELWHIEDERFATLGWVGKTFRKISRRPMTSWRMECMQTGGSFHQC